MPPEDPFEHRVFREIEEWIEPGDVVVVNDSRVLPARLLGRKSTGAAVEVLLLRRSGDADDVWEALVRPGSKVKPGAVVQIGADLEIDVLDIVPGGGRRVRVRSATSVEEALEAHGHMPLPPYIDRPDEVGDRERYQTVYADRHGSVAAPTAGLHFTPELLAGVERRGATIARVTLHVGIGTFRPVEVDDPADHRMHSEWYEVSPDAARTIEHARNEGGRVWAVGTTSVRTLESAAAGDGRVRAGAGDTRLFIRPPYNFRVVDGLITNFHLPRSTLMMLVAARAGYERTMRAYAEAVRAGYRFYSYGDAMVITPRGG